MVATRIASSSRALRAHKLLNAAQHPLTDLSAVMGSPPTITDPVDGANSTIRAAQSPTGPFYSSSDATRITIYGGVINVVTGVIQTMTALSSRVGGHAAGFGFYTDASACDFSLKGFGSNWIAYVTDPDGVRRRIAAADRATLSGSNANYYKLDFGSTAGGGRLVEVYTDPTTAVFGVNVASGYSIWAAPQAHQPRIALIWDSFGEGKINDTTLDRKLSVPDWFAAPFGCSNPWCFAIGGTGVLATSGGSKTTYGQRVAAGDINVSRVGEMDLILAAGSINDHNLSAGGLAIPSGDATLQTAQQSYISALMAAQPNAIIVGVGQQSTAAASRTAAYKAGFVAAAAGDPRMLWLDNTLFANAADTGVIGADSVHPAGIFGARHIGERLARQAQGALLAIAP